MYHNKEILNLFNSLGRVQHLPQDCHTSEQPTRKRRFGDLMINDLFIFDGKTIKKTGDLTAETNVRTGKQFFIFYKKDVVNSVTDYDAWWSPAGLRRGKLDANVVSSVNKVINGSKIVISFNSAHSAILVTINDKIINKTLCSLSNEGFIVGVVDLGVFVVNETHINKNYVKFTESSCQFYIDGVKTSEINRGLQESDILTISFNNKQPNKIGYL